MIVVRAAGRSRPLFSVLLALGLLLAAVPGASASAQSPLEQAYATLGKIPGLRSQLPNLQVTANSTAAADWAAAGEVVLNKRLREWFKPLVNGRLGWGELPKAGAPVLATFVGLARKAGPDGPAAVVVHQGYSDGTKLVTQGSAADPFEADASVDSFGLWWQDGTGFYAQAASSSVGAGGVNWFDSRFKGAGGIDKRMMANVVPISKGGSGGGGGNPPPGGGGGNPPPGGGGGGNPPPGGGDPPGDGGGDHDAAAEPVPEAAVPGLHLALDTTDPDDPTRRKLGDLVWQTGVYDLRRDFAPGGDPTTCVSVFGTPVDGFGVIEINLQSIVPYDLATLEQAVKLHAFDAEGNFLGEFGAEWLGHVPTGPYAGAFIYQGIAELPYTPTPIASVRLAPDADIRGAVLASSGQTADDPVIALGQVAHAATPNRVAIPGRDGVQPCGTFASEDLDVCSDDIVDALTDVAALPVAEPQLEGTPATGSKGSKECHGTSNGQPVAFLGFTGEPATSEKLEEVAQIPACPTAKPDPERPELVVAFCDLFTLYLWLQEVPGIDPAEALRSPLHYAVSLAIVRSAEDSFVIPEGGQPMSLGEELPLAALNELRDAVDAATREANWGLAVPPTGNA